ncbi:hypothetical protein FACS1894132_14510 [Clostridia bacterium]|nr:hypothetical protein FACS1894132_14510 [Clostridia bacterium]
MANLKGIPKETKPLVYVFYVILIAVMGIFGLFFGVAVDDASSFEAETQRKVVDFSKLKMPEISYKIIKEHIDADPENTYVKSMGMIFAVGTGIAVLYFTTGKRRLHRRGEEHGSARWAKSTEKRGLEDKVFRKTKDGLTADKLLEQAKAEKDPAKSEKLREKSEKIKSTKRCFYYSGAVPVKYVILKNLEEK